MSFDIFTDAPQLLRTEASNITIKFERTSQTTARVSWNIPSPAAGCGSDSQAYAGIVITLDTTPTNSSKIPSNGTLYSADATDDNSLFAGDYIGTSKVVGSFYNDTTTTFVDISNIQPSATYYVTGFPVDKQYRYYIEGVHAYSMDITNRGTADTNGTQVVVLNPQLSTMGIHGSDPTGLDPTKTYSFKIQLGITPQPQSPVYSTDCTLSAPVYTITINGNSCATYQDLVNEINKQLSTIGNIQQSDSPPNSGTFVYNTAKSQLTQWTGYQYVDVSSIVNVIIQSLDPSIVAANTFWLNTQSSVMNQYISNAWVQPQTITYPTDPTIPSIGTLWYNGTAIYGWSGNAWCDQQAIIDTNDVSIQFVPDSNTFWFNLSNGLMYKWDTTQNKWISPSLIRSSSDPNNLPDGELWFNQTNNSLYSYLAGSWTQQANLSISSQPPTTPGPDKFWYNPSNNKLQQWNVNNQQWVVVEFIAYPVAPNQLISCDLWWNPTAGVLKIWDVVNSAWNQVSVISQTSDPTIIPTLSVGTVWFNPTTNLMSKWNGYCFIETQYINFPTDPTKIADGIVWHNISIDSWQIRASNNWNAISYTKSSTDPTSLASNTLWMNPTTNSLKMWNGINWTNVSYTTNSMMPSKGALWFDISTSKLKTWNGETWVVGTPQATCSIDCNGNLLFTHNIAGSTSFVMLTDVDLFGSFANQTTLDLPVPGTDGASDKPSYEELGIGTSGSNDARRQMQNEIRYELGYPVVDVELTPEQLDYAIDRALSDLRSRSGLPYKRGFFFMQINPDTQTFYLTNKIQGMNKIVDVLGVYRLTSAFLASAHGAGVYGQIVLQHMYNMGTFDLLSYHIMSEYTKLMEMLFAARITFTWNEQTRQLFLHHRFTQAERQVCVEATTERTEQDLLTDRYSRSWIRRYAIAVSRLMLSEIRGKYSSLPGASGNITLNASELRQSAQKEIDACIQEIEDYIADKPDEYGMGAQFIFG